MGIRSAILEREVVEQRGFTLAEMMVTMMLLGILLTLGASAFRHYWLVQSLEAAQDELVTQVRQRQEQAVSESHPLVFGVRLQEGSSDWGVVEYVPDDPETTGTDEETCVEVQTFTFSTSVRVSTATFAATTESAACASELGVGSDYALFYPRGSATGGSATLLQPTLGRTRVITIRPITGRVDGS